MNVIVKITETAMLLISPYILKGDTVVDATMGNGKDTLFLAELVGESGRVYSFDIQEQAIDHTRQLLTQSQKLNDNISLINDSHENIDHYVKEEVAAAVFNLGYLPGGSKEITTKGDTTVVALKKILTLLKKEGIISVLIYSGHGQGKREKEVVLDFLSKLDDKMFHVVSFEMINQKNSPPNLVMVTKK